MGNYPILQEVHANEFGEVTNLAKVCSAPRLIEPVAYLIIAPSVGMVKVGSTSRLKHRLASYNTQSPVPVSIWCAVTGCGRHHFIENRVHCILSEFRDHGEWFKVDLATAKTVLLNARASILAERDKDLKIRTVETNG
jgi:hypothetical protein